MIRRGMTYEEDVIRKFGVHDWEEKPECKTCQLPYIHWANHWIPDGYCVHGHPERAPAVIRGIPSWLYRAVTIAYPSEVGAWSLRWENDSRTKTDILHDDVQLTINQGSFAPSCLVGFIDHYGHDKAGNFVTEPYGRNCKGCHKDAAAFAERIGATLTQDNLTYHCPWSENAIRMTFSLRGKT
jgi:hypothetical protein